MNYTKGLDLTLTPQVVAKLEQVVHRSRDKFTQDLTRRLVAIRQANDECQRGEIPMDRFIGFVREESLQIKGAGGTIGFPLLSEIGHLLGQLLKSKRRLEDVEVELVMLHVDALYVVLARRIMGGGDEVEQQVVKALATAVAKYA